MPLPLIPIVVGLGGLAFWRAGRSTLRGMVTPDRQATFLKALQKNDPPLTPEQLQTVAATFEGEGLHGLGGILRKRAALRKMSPAEKEKRSAIYKALMSIKDPARANLIRQAADAFDADSAYGQATTLRDYATALEAQKHMVAMAEVTAPPPAPSTPDVSTPAAAISGEEEPETHPPVALGSVL
jgi:hypothetical protein